ARQSRRARDHGAHAPARSRGGSRSPRCHRRGPPSAPPRPRSLRASAPHPRERLRRGRAAPRLPPAAPASPPPPPRRLPSPHHARKGAARAGAGQALRGSSEFHAWGDSTLYLRRVGEQLTLTVEHRAAASITGITLALAGDGDGLALCVSERRPDADTTSGLL